MFWRVYPPARKFHLLCFRFPLIAGFPFLVDFFLDFVTHCGVGCMNFSRFLTLLTLFSSIIYAKKREKRTKLIFFLRIPPYTLRNWCALCVGLNVKKMFFSRKFDFVYISQRVVVTTTSLLFICLANDFAFALVSFRFIGNLSVEID